MGSGFRVTTHPKLSEQRENPKPESLKSWSAGVSRSENRHLSPPQSIIVNLEAPSRQKSWTCAPVLPSQPTRKKVPLTVHELAILERMAVTADPYRHDAIIAGFACVVLHCRVSSSTAMTLPLPLTQARRMSSRPLNPKPYKP